jgi:hypothetical protein
MKNKIFISIIAIVLAVSGIFAATFAWTNRGATATNFKFSIAFVDMRLALYQINDTDLDGIPDYQRVENPDPNVSDSDIQIKVPEKNDSSVGNTSSSNNSTITRGNYVYQGEEMFNTSNADSEAEIDSMLKDAGKQLILTNLMPGQVYTYLLVIYNQGDVDSYLSFDIVDNEDFINPITTPSHKDNDESSSEGNQENTTEEISTLVDEDTSSSQESENSETSSDVIKTDYLEVSAYYYNSDNEKTYLDINCDKNTANTENTDTHEHNEKDHCAAPVPLNEDGISLGLFFQIKCIDSPYKVDDNSSIDKSSIDNNNYGANFKFTIFA